MRKDTQDRLFKNKKINVIWDSVVDEITGTKNPNSVTGINIRNTKSNKTGHFETDGVFIAIGHKPATELFTKDLETKNGYILTTPGSTKTSISGVFAAGDVTDEKYRQAVTAAGMGYGNLDAENFLTKQNIMDLDRLKNFSYYLRMLVAFLMQVGEISTSQSLPVSRQSF